MWELTNRTPYAVGKSWTRDKHGARHWLVAVKATFDIGVGGRLRLADEQAPALLMPEFWDDPGTSSLRHDADIIPPKPTTDVLVEGSAHAPGQRSTAKVMVALRIADVEKSLVVHGPRIFRRDGGRLAPSASEPFMVRPIRFEDAYGGADLTPEDPRRRRYDPRNPVGKGVATDLSHLIGQPAYAIEYPTGDPTSRGPAGFGPLADFWSPRRERGGTFDEAWERLKKPLLPDDYDERALQAAPDDQRPVHPLYGGETLEVTNLTREGTLKVQLPKIYLAFSTWFGERSEEHRSRLGTVLLEPDAKQLKLVWQTSLPVRNMDIEYLDRTIISEKPYI